MLTKQIFTKILVSALCVGGVGLFADCPSKQCAPKPECPPKQCAPKPECPPKVVLPNCNCIPQFFVNYDSSWYLGAGGLVNDYCFISQNVVPDDTLVQILEAISPGVNAGSSTSVNSTNSGWGYQVFGGYNFNPYVALELKFLQMVSPFKTQEQSVLAVPGSPAVTIAWERKVKQIAFGPATLFTFPAFQYIMPYLKCGVYAYYYSDYEVFDGISGEHARAWAVRLMGGYGIRSQFADWFGLRLEYETPINQTLNNQARLIYGNLSLSAYFSY